MGNYYVYVMASGSGMLYVGCTNDLVRRVYEHKQNLVKGFTQKYACHKLIYYESFDDQENALLREKQLKGWKREKKEWLISKFNPTWGDLYEEII